MKCDNCTKDALFEYKITDKKSNFFCESHLPKFLTARKKAGLLNVTNRFEEAKKEALEILSPEPIEEPVIEEPVIEKPKKKAAKKKAE